MRKLIVAIFALALASVIALAQRTPRQDEVEIEMMTYPEIYSAIHDHGWTRPAQIVDISGHGPAAHQCG